MRQQSIMRDVIRNCTEIIHKQTILLANDKSPLSQQDVVNRINRYCTQLTITAQFVATDEDQQIAQRHELINILTPIMGYVEMLADGWIGKLNPDQEQHIDLIQHAVDHMRQSILAFRYQHNLSESA